MGGAVHDREAYIALNLLPGIGSLRVKQLLSIFGSPGAILEAKKCDLTRVSGIGPVLAETICDWRRLCDPGTEQQLAARAGIQLVTLADPGYPAMLAEIFDPPLCLYVRGNPGALDCFDHALAIVGTRRPTHYGIQMAQTLAASAAMAGWTVVSGLAQGIDTAGHQATVQHKGRTLAVLGSGLGRLYPQDNVDLARRIAESGGAVISEFPIQMPPDRRTFPMRNRIISGLTRATVVVEAGLRSGALITAAQALDQGRQVFAVPGRADSPQARGCHQLLRDGAGLVEEFIDILREFPGGNPAPISAPPPSQTSSGAEPRKEETEGWGLQLSQIERKIYAFVARDEVHIDDLICQLGEPAAKILSAVVTLEMRHLVRQLPGRRLCRQAGSNIA